MSLSKTQYKPLSNPSPRPPVGAPAQEAVGLLPQPDPLADARGNPPRKNARSAVPGAEADACGNAPRKKSRTAALGAEADACGNAPRKNARSAVPGVEADACGDPPRKNTRPVGRSGHVRGRRPHRRRSLATVSPSLPRLSPDSPGMEGEIALLRSLTNRLLSKRPIDHVQISRYLRILARSLPANSRMPRELTDQEQIDSLIKKVFQDNVDNGNLDFPDIVPVRMARPGEKWWPWRELLPLDVRWRHGLIDPDERWPQEENERLAENEALESEMEAIDRLILKYYPGPLPDLEEDPDDEEDPNDDHRPDYDPPPYGEAPPTSTVIPEKSETNPLLDSPPDEEPHRDDSTVIPEKSETNPLLDSPPDEEPHRDGLAVIPAEVVGVADVEDAHGRAGIHPREESRLSSKTPQPENPPQQDAPSRESIPHNDLAPGAPTPRRTARGRPRPP